MPALLLVFVLALQCIGSSPLKAAVLADETIAPVTPVIETDLSALLQGRVAEASRIGLFAREQARTRESMRRHLRRPASSGQNGALTGALRDASYDVTLIPREQLANMTPTARRAVQSLVRTYLLLDADDAAQVAWVSNQLRHVDGTVTARVVVLAGDIDRLQRTLGIRVYADQSGTLRNRFAVTALPARVDVTGVRAHVSIVAVGRQ